MRKKKLYEIIHKLEKRIHTLEINRVKIQLPTPKTKHEYTERDWDAINKSIAELKQSVGWFNED